MGLVKIIHDHHDHHSRDYDHDSDGNSDLLSVLFRTRQSRPREGVIRFIKKKKLANWIQNQNIALRLILHHCCHSSCPFYQYSCDIWKQCGKAIKGISLGGTKKLQPKGKHWWNPIGWKVRGCTKRFTMKIFTQPQISERSFGCGNVWRKRTFLRLSGRIPLLVGNYGGEEVGRGIHLNDPLKESGMVATLPPLFSPVVAFGG